MPRSLVQMTHPMRCAKQPPQSLKRLTLFEPRSLTRADCAARQRLTSVTRPAARCKRGDGPTRKHARSHARGASQHGNLWCGLSCMISAAAYALGGGPEARPPRPSPHLHALTSRMSVAARPALQPRGFRGGAIEAARSPPMHRKPRGSSPSRQLQNSPSRHRRHHRRRSRSHRRRPVRRRRHLVRSAAQRAGRVPLTRCGALSSPLGRGRAAHTHSSANSANMSFGKSSCG